MQDWKLLGPEDLESKWEGHIVTMSEGWGLLFPVDITNNRNRVCPGGWVAAVASEYVSPLQGSRWLFSLL